MSFCNLPRIHHLRSWRTLALIIFAFAAFFTTALSAQVETGIVIGAVKDREGVPMRGASIRAMEINKKVVFTAKTNKYGVFELLHLPAGRYEIVSHAKDYKTTKYMAFSLLQNQTAHIDILMKPSEQCGIEAKPIPILQLDSSELSTTIDSYAIERLPL